MTPPGTTGSDCGVETLAARPRGARSPGLTGERAERSAPGPLQAPRPPRTATALQGKGHRAVFIAFAVLGAAGLTLLSGEAVLRVRERFLLGRAAPTNWAGDYLAYLKVSHEADRMFLRDPSDPVIGYRNRPGFSLELPLPSGRLWSCHINSLGFRGPEFSPRKAEGTFRVLCLGGSTTFWGYRDEETYPALLESRLRAWTGDSRVEVLNLGVSGYTSTMSAERLRREYRSFEPDLVVVYHGTNDLMCLAPGRYRHRILRSLLLATVWNLALGFCEGGEGAGLAPEVTARFDREIAPRYDLLRSEAEKAGARLLVLTFPGPEQKRLTARESRFLEAELYRSWRELGSLRAYLAALDAYNARLRKWAKRTGTPLVDAARCVRGTTDIYMDIAHMNTEGLQRIAGLVAVEIIEKGWLQGPRPAGSPRDRAPE